MRIPFPVHFIVIPEHLIQLVWTGLLDQRKRTGQEQGLALMNYFLYQWLRSCNNNNKKRKLLRTLGTAK